MCRVEHVYVDGDIDRMIFDSLSDAVHQAGHAQVVEFGRGDTSSQPNGGGAVASAVNGLPDVAADVPIGAQLKAARLAARKTIAEVAEQAGLTKGFVSKLERDLTKVSVASLIRLCAALDVSVGALFQPQHGEIVRHGAYPPINFGGEGISEYLLTPSSEKRVQAILSEIEPGGGSGADPYPLPADVEFVFVLTGELGITIAGAEIILGRGDAFTFPADTLHTFRATARTGRTKVLWVVSPALPETGSLRSPGQKLVTRS